MHEDFPIFQKASAVEYIGDIVDGGMCKVLSKNEICVVDVFGEIACAETQVLACFLGWLVLTDAKNGILLLAVVFGSLFWNACWAYYSTNVARKFSSTYARCK